MKTLYEFRYNRFFLNFIPVFFLGLCITNVIAQEAILDKIVTIEFSDKNLEKVFVELERVSGTTFSYAPDTFKSEILVNKSYRKTALRQILNDILKEYEVYYRAVGNTIQIQTEGKIGKIKGRVTDTKNKPVPFAAVFIKNTTRGTSSDENGYFSFDAPSSIQELGVSIMGFLPYSRMVNVVPNQAVELQIRIQPTIEDLDEVVVRGESEKTQIEKTAQAVRIIDLKEVKLKTLDLGEVLARTEGVAIQRAGGLGSGTRVSLNGLTDNQIRIFIDGIPLEFAGYTLDIANVPVGLIQRVEIYKGVVPIEFGADALGGAINLVTYSSKTKLSGSLSHQNGSFGTNRVAFNIGTNHQRTGFFIRAASFYDFARNDFEIDVEVPDERGRLSSFTVPRFNDRFRARGLNLTFGVTNRKWAKELSLNTYFADVDREIQNNVVQSGLPYGEAESFSEDKGLNLVYRITRKEGFSLGISAGYGVNDRSTVDLTDCRYNWFGECILRARNIGEFTPNGTDRTITDTNAFARLSVSYGFNENHSLTLITAPTYTKRTGRERLVSRDQDPFRGDSDLLAWVTGFEHKYLSSNGKLENRLFLKDYRQSLNLKVPTANRGRTFATNDGDIASFGAGNVLRIQWSAQLQNKISYERTVRLPTRTEFLGDGLFIIPNINLDPEKSHNLNFETKISGDLTKSVPWNINTNFFLRVTDNLITLISQDEVFNAFQNVFSATSSGVEFSGQIEIFKKRLMLYGNTTYQSFRNTSTEGLSSNFKGDRIPNRPYFFINANVNYRFESLFKENDNLNVFANNRYVKSFFRSWESAGNREFAIEIPSQTTYGVGFTYNGAVREIRWSLTGEVQNLTNARVFDFLGVQRPGRAFYIKLTTQI